MPMFMNDYFRYLLALLIPVAFTRFKSTPNLLLVILFSAFYTLAFYIRQEPLSPSALAYNLLYPPMMYIIGYSLATRFKSYKSDTLLIVLLCFCIALPAIYYNFVDFQDTKALINSKRIITFGNDGPRRNATGYGMMLSLALTMTGAVFLNARNRFEKSLKISQTIFAILAIFCTVRLVNRTGLIIAGTSVVIALLFQGLPRKNIFKIIISVIFIIIALSIINTYSNWITDAITFYDKRDHGVGSVDTYGGRSVRWLASLYQIAEYPLGSTKLMVRGYHYAHNLWLDAGIKGGVLSMLLLIIITIRFIITFFGVYRQKKLSIYEKNTFLLISIGLMLQSFTEPVIEGMPVLFWIWIFYFGMLDSLMVKFKRNLL